MVLNPNPNYPLAHSYVLKLHRDAAQRGEIVGRLENMASGECCDFVTGEQLLACLSKDCMPPSGSAGAEGASPLRRCSGQASTGSGQTDNSTDSAPSAPSSFFSAVTDLPSHAPGTSPSSRTSAFPLNRFFIRTRRAYLPRRFSPAWLLTTLALVSSVGLLAGRPSFSAQPLATSCPAALGNQMNPHYTHLAAQIGRGLDIPQENSK